VQMQTPAWRRVLRAVLTVLMSLVLIAVFYVAVVMGQPQPRDGEIAAAPADQPLLPPLSAAVRITDMDQIDRLAEAFPAPLLCPMYGNALVLLEGVCSDVAYEEGFARVATLTFRTETFDTLTVTSIYPARALTLMGKGDYAFSGMAGQPMATLRSVRMEDGSSIRLHAQGEEALYVFTAPDVSTDVLRQWTSSLQLYVGT